MAVPTYAYMVPTGREDYARRLLASSIMRADPDLVQELYVPMRKKLIHLTDTKAVWAARHAGVTIPFAPNGREKQNNGSTGGKHDWIEVPEVLFPGYLLCACHDHIKMRDEIRNFAPKTFFNMLGMTDPEYQVVTEDELEHILQLCGDEHMLEASTGIKENGRVRFISGPLVGHEADVLYINRHHRYAMLQIKFLGEMRKVKVAVDVLSAVPS